MSRVLGIDTSGPGGGAALLLDDAVTVARVPADVRRGRTLVPLVRGLLEDAGLSLHAAYWVEPSCESPRHWIRLEHRGPALHYLSQPQYREGAKGRLFRRLLRAVTAAGGAGLCASNLLIVGARPPREPRES